MVSPFRTNLYPLEPAAPLTALSYRVLWREGFEESRDCTNRLVYEISERSGRPAFWHEGKLWLLASEPLPLESDLAGLTEERRQELKTLPFEAAQALAKFFARRLGPLAVEESGHLRTERRPLLKAYGLFGRPHLAIDYRSDLSVRSDLQQELSRGVVTPGEVKELLVEGGSSPFLVEEIGPLGEEEIREQRQRARRPESQRGWELAERRLQQGEHLFLVRGRFHGGGRRYTYPALMARRLVRPEQLSPEELRALRPPPEVRAGLIAQLAGRVQRLASRFGLRLGRPVSQVEQLEASSTLLDASGRRFQLQNPSLARCLEQLTPFLRKPELQLFLILLGIDHKCYQEQVHAIRASLEGMGVKIRWSRMRFAASSRKEALAKIESEEFLEQIRQRAPEIVLVVLREFDEPPLPGGRTLYDLLKERLTWEQIPSQIVLERTLAQFDRYRLYNIVLGILAKTGNYPYRVELPEKLYLGLDVARIALGGGRSLNQAGVAKFFQGGTFFRYVIKKFPLAGERLDGAFAEFVAGEVARLRERGLVFPELVIHRDGPMGPAEREAFEQALLRRGIENYALLSVVKRGNPRLFLERQGRWENPPRGAFLRLDERSGLLTTYPLRPSQGSAQPLKITLIRGRERLENYAQEILALTLLNYGSFRFAKLPATVAYADKMAQFALKGYLKEGEGERMFWL